MRVVDPLKLISLNIEGSKHLDRIIPFLQSEGPDVICLQEVFEKDLVEFSTQLAMECVFAPYGKVTTPNRYNIPNNGPWGVALLTKKTPDTVETHYYKGAGDMPEFSTPTSVDRVLLTVQISHQGCAYPIATTHFTWSSGGEPSEEQRQDLDALLSCLEQYPDLVLCGDLNAPRGGEIFDMFLQQFHDYLPSEITTTIDKDLHYAGDLQLVVDALLCKGTYSAQNVRVVGGMSDHMAVVGEIAPTL